MKPRTPKPNPWLLLNRSIKVAKFVVSFEDECKRGGLDCVRRIVDVVTALEGWNDADWRAAFVLRGLTPPSADTKLAVIEALKMRALDARRERWTA